MTGRSLSARFDVVDRAAGRAEGRGQEGGGQAQRRVRRRRRRRAGPLPPAPGRAGRRAADVDADQHPGRRLRGDGRQPVRARPLRRADEHRRPARAHAAVCASWWRRSAPSRRWPSPRPIAGVLNRLPTGITTQLFGGMLKGIDFVTSNVPGAPIPVYLAGAQVEANYALGPLSGAAINVTLLSATSTTCSSASTATRPPCPTPTSSSSASRRASPRSARSLDHRRRRRRRRRARPAPPPPSRWPAPAATSSLVDRARFPRDKCCGDGLTAGALRRYEALGLDPSAMPSWQAVDDVMVRSPSGRTVRLPAAARRRHLRRGRRREPTSTPRSSTWRRSAGVECTRARRSRAPTSGPHWASVDVDGVGTVAAHYVIGADGMWSPLRKAVGRRRRGRLPGRVARVPAVLRGRRASKATRPLGVVRARPPARVRVVVPAPRRPGQRRLRRPPAPDGDKIRGARPDASARTSPRCSGAGARAEAPAKAWPIPARVERSRARPRAAGGSCSSATPPGRPTR